MILTNATRALEKSNPQTDSRWRAESGEKACVEWTVAVLMDCCLVIQLCSTLYDHVDCIWLPDRVNGHCCRI